MLDAEGQLLPKVELSEQEFRTYCDWQQVMEEINLSRYRLELNFPKGRSAVLTTSLGNAIKAFEDYPRDRFGMESIALWPRLLPALRESRYYEIVAQEKTTFDFLLNMLVVTVLLGFEFLYLFVYTAQPLLILVMIPVALGLFVLFYQGLVIAAREWGTTVRVAFDLHRRELFNALRLKPVTSTIEEYKRWRQISAFIMYRQEQYSQSIFVNSSEPSSQERQSYRESH